MQVAFNEQIQFGDWIRIIPKGTFYRGGQVYKFDETYLLKLKENFDKNLFGQQVPVNFEHQNSPLGAAGWVKALEVRDDGLYAEIEWTDIGKEAIEKGRFKYVSVELGGTVDPKTGKELKDVLTGIALTNRPFFKALTALAASEPNWVANDEPFEIQIHDDRNYEWDADESEKRWRSWVSEKEPEEWSEREWQRYRRRFLAYDRANPNLFGSYKLPVVDIINGQPRVIFRAIVAVLAALAGARGGVDLPSDVKEKVRSIAERIRSKFEGGEQKMSEQVVSIEEFQKVADEVSQLRKEQRKLLLKETLSSITFSEGKYALAPSVREKLLSVLVELNDEQVKALLDAIRSIQFVPLGELGFSAPQSEEKETLQSFAEKIAKERSISFSEAVRIASGMRPDLAYKHFGVRIEGGEK